MRTANKLLLSFVALIVLLMLFTNIVLWANFKEGKSGSDFVMRKKQNNNVKLQPVNVLYLTGISNRIRISPGDNPEIITGGDTSTHVFTYVQKNDTLYLDMHSTMGNPWLSIPAIRSIHMGKGSSIAVNAYKIPELDIYMEDNCDAELYSMIIGKLDIEGGKESRLSVQGDGKDHEGVGSFSLKLGRNSEFRSNEMPYLHTEMQVDSLKILEMSGASLSALKEIK